MAGLLGEEHPQVGFMTQTLGSLYREMGRYDVALKMYDESLHIARKAEGERSKKVGDILQCMGNVLAQQERHDSAIDKYKQARGIYKETIGPENTSMANTLTGLANVYCEIAKKAGDDSMFDKCIKYYMEALRISRIVNSREGGDGRYVAGTLMNLAAVFCCLGLLDKGMAHYEEALGILRSVHGEKHPVVATVFKNIGDLLEKQGKQEEALKMYKKVLKISRKALGEAHADVLDALIAIGNNHLRQGRSEEALEAMEEALAALAARNRVMGVEDPYAAEVYKTMAGAKLLGGDMEGAFDCIDKAVGIYAKHGITNESSKQCEQLRVEMEARVSRAP
jgi:tetratricopeptide (TPR) repeat protein